MFPEKPAATRHASLLDAGRSVLALVDLQERFHAAIPDFNAVVARTEFLTRAAARLNVPVLVSEQYPKGLGALVPSLAAALPPATPLHEKLCFSACDLPAWTSALNATLNAARGPRRNQIILCGVETHVCILQTALDLAATDVGVYVVADAVSSRRETDKQTALRRLEAHGIQIVTSEMVMFEWLRKAGTEDFKELQKLVK